MIKTDQNIKKLADRSTDLPVPHLDLVLLTHKAAKGATQRRSQNFTGITQSLPTSEINTKHQTIKPKKRTKTTIKLPDITYNIPTIQGTQSYYRIISHLFNQIKRIKLPKETSNMHLQQFSIIMCILKIEAESGIVTAKDLCHTTGLEKWSISIIINALETKGLIKRGYIRGITAGRPTRSIYIQLPKQIAKLYYGKECFDPDNIQTNG